MTIRHPGIAMLRRASLIVLVLFFNACGGCGEKGNGPKKVEPCGDGIVGIDETCDTAILAGSGACPTECPSFDTCAPMQLQGGACQAECVEVIPECGPADSCCPSGCAEGEDDDCVGEALCGNGLIDGIETCDFGIAPGNPGACECPAINSVCETVEESGLAAFCSLECSTRQITSCTSGDGCCPAGCSGSDSDCPSECGNGVVEGGEVCDGNCPIVCDDGDACTNDFLSGSEANCDAVCQTDVVTACTDGDGCCGQGCNANTDSDCMPACGNDVVEAGETCDGNCPVACDDGVACTDDVLMGSSATCDVECQAVPITACVSNDGCCAPGCTFANDNDCSATCGNGLVEPPEICDGNCPLTCDDGNTCTADMLFGSAASCTATCANTPITLCINNDGCCPAACTFAIDNDCACIPDTCASQGFECGMVVDDGCMGGGEMCASCGAGETCIVNQCEPNFDVGNACTSDLSCAGGSCLRELDLGWDDGYCTLTCSSDLDCGAPNHCGADGVCWKDCVTNADCRTGYECFDFDTDGTNECAPVANGAGAVGTACDRYGDCAGGQDGFCVIADPNGFKDGFCSELCAFDSDCPANSHCFAGAICVPNCASAASCRGNGYDCYDADSDATNECYPTANGLNAVGASCTGYWDCNTGEFGGCITAASGWSGGYCTERCGAAEGMCDSGQACWNDSAAGESLCLDSCQNANQCRGGYQCADPGGLGSNACVP